MPMGVGPRRSARSSHWLGVRGEVSTPRFLLAALPPLSCGRRVGVWATAEHSVQGFLPWHEQTSWLYGWRITMARARGEPSHLRGRQAPGRTSEAYPRVARSGEGLAVRAGGPPPEGRLNCLARSARG